MRKDPHVLFGRLANGVHQGLELTLTVAATDDKKVSKGGLLANV